MNQILKIVLIFVVWSSITIFGGWKLNTYYTGYQTSLKQEVTLVVEQGLRDIQSTKAGELNTAINDLKGIKPSTVTITEKPIYMTQCVDDDGIAALKKYKEQSNAKRLY